MTASNKTFTYGTSKVDDGLVGTPSYTFGSDATTGLYYTSGPATLNLAVGGAQIGKFTSGGLDLLTGTLTFSALTVTNNAITSTSGGDLSISTSGGSRVALSGKPTANNHAATKAYVDDSANLKQSVRVATTANIATLAGGAPDTVDGVTLSAGDRVLVKDQTTTTSQNGVYSVTTVGTGSNGTWVRASDFTTSSQFALGQAVIVLEGTVSAGKEYFVSTYPAAVDTDPWAWTSLAGGSSGSSNTFTTQTTDATVTTVATIGITATTTSFIEVSIAAIKSDASQGAAYHLKGAFRNNAGTVAQIGTLVSTVFEDDTNWDATMSISGTNVLVTVQGVASATIEWDGSYTVTVGTA